MTVKELFIVEDVETGEMISTDDNNDFTVFLGRREAEEAAAEETANVGLPDVRYGAVRFVRCE